VWQTLTLWKHITQRMFTLWRAADADLLSERNYYRLANTGQGLNRVQSCTAVGGFMQQILGWGLSPSLPLTRAPFSWSTAWFDGYMHCSPSFLPLMEGPPRKVCRGEPPG